MSKALSRDVPFGRRVGSYGVGTCKLQTSDADAMEERDYIGKRRHNNRHSKYGTIEVYIA